MKSRITGDRQLDWLRFLADRRLIGQRDLEESVERIAADVAVRLAGIRARIKKRRRRGR